MSRARSPARRPRAAGRGTAPLRGGRAPSRSAPQAAAGFSPLPVQRKLALGRAGDAWEAEADRVGQRVAEGAPAPDISRLPPGGLAAAQRATDEAADEEETLAQTQAEEEEEEPVQTQGEEEEEEVQTATAEVGEREEDAPVQTQAEDETEDAVQTDAMEEEEEPAQAKDAEEEPEEEPAQTKAAGPLRRDRRAAEQAVRSPGAGAPIPEPTRRRIESSTGADLSDVRVHDDARAAEAAESLNARAFAHGRDIWLGAGESARDARLMGHEAAHVVQQTGRSQSRSAAPAAGAAPVQRAPDPAGGHSEVDGSELDMGAKTLTIPEIALPAVAGKDAASGPFEAQPPGARETSQRLNWLQEMTVDPTAVEAATPDDKVVPVPPASGEAGGAPATVEGGRAVPGVWFLRLGRSQEFIIGSRETLAEAGKLPNWKKAGTKEFLQVDHKHEDQLGGPDALDNYQLIDGRTNRKLGDAIRKEIKDRINRAVARHLDAHPAVRGEPDPFEAVRERRGKADEIRRWGKVTFERKASDPLAGNFGPAHLWEVGDIKTAEHLKVLTPTNDPRVIPPFGSGSELVIFGAEGGSRATKIPLKGGAPQFAGPRKWFAGIQGLTVNSVSYEAGALSLNTTFFKYGQLVKSVDEPLPLQSLGGNPYTFQMPTDLSQTGIAKALELKKASPITVTGARIVGEQVMVEGTVGFTSKLFEGATADLVIEGEDVRLSKTFTAGEFSIPGPLTVTDSSLTISAGVAGGRANLMLEGDVNFEVERVGTGRLSGKGGLATGVAVEGEFEFDPALFRGADAKIKIRYAEDRFSGEGVIKIGPDQIRGIKSAELTVAVDDEQWSAEGVVEPDVPGVSEGSLSMTFRRDGGFEITGRLTLGEGIPRLKAGHLEATLKKEGEAYLLSGSGTAEFDIPGVAAAVTAEYRDGLFKAEGAIAYARGIASGTLTVGATNMPVDENGQPGGEPGETLSLYGSGSVTIRFTPWLEGTAGIKVAPDGSIEVRGEVALPDSVEVFPEKKLEKELFSIGVDIPIVGVSVAGQRVGIFLNIGGALTARASIGPGALEDVSVEVVYNPEDEANATVTGTARFVVPAEAGLRLAIRGAIGAGIPIVSAQAGLELGGELGVEGEASAGATIEWSPATGISMEADVSILAQPKFTFDVTGFVEVTADLLLTEIDLYSERWRLASIEYGSNMQVGARLKVVVENNEVKPIGLDDVEFITPQVDPIDTVAGLLRNL